MDWTGYERRRDRRPLSIPWVWLMYMETGLEDRRLREEGA